MQEGDPIAYQHPHSQNNNFLDELLDEDPPGSHALIPSSPLRSEQEEEAPEGTRENMRRNSVMLFENEDLDCPLPEKPYQEQGEEEEEDHFQLEEPREKAQNETTPSHKRAKISKLAYQEEKRIHKIERYREKKSRRIWNRKIFYDCRKVVADSRQRVNGRFIKKSPVASFMEPPHKGSMVTGEVESGRGGMEEVREIDQFYL